MRVLDENFTLSNGVEIPKIGFGTWQIKEGDLAYGSVTAALEAGYRHIDTAFVYGNEKSVGKAVKDFSRARSEIFITSKIPAQIKNYKGAKEHFEKSMENLGLDVIDLMLIHAPWPWTAQWRKCDAGNIEVWTALEEFYAAGRVRSIGISNFNIREIKNITDNCKTVPMVNQIRFFIGKTKEEITEYCQKTGIQVEGYSPLATGKIVKDKRLKSLAEKYNVTIPQICIRYLIERNVLPLPKSTHSERIIKNAEIDFKITAEDMAYLNSLK